jgi:hypothetical protein
MKARSIALLLVFFAMLAGGAAAIAVDGGCASLCKQCSEMCAKNLDYFKKKGGKYTEASRVNTMKDCVKICDTNHDFKTRQSANSAEVDKACGVICKKCAQVCTDLKDPKLKDCIEMCSKCGTACDKQEK